MFITQCEKVNYLFKSKEHFVLNLFLVDVEQATELSGVVVRIHLFGS